MILKANEVAVFSTKSERVGIHVATCSVAVRAAAERKMFPRFVLVTSQEDVDDLAERAFKLHRCKCTR